MLFFVILFTIVILWRPSSTNRLYARSAFLDPDVEPPPEDFEELLIDTIVSGELRHSFFSGGGGVILSLFTWDEINSGEVVPVSIAPTTSQIASAQAWRSCVQVIPSDSRSRFHRLRP